MTAPQQAEDGDTYHRMGNHNRQVDNAFHQPLAGKVVSSQQIREGGTEDKGNQGCAHCRVDRQPDR